MCVQTLLIVFLICVSYRFKALDKNIYPIDDFNLSPIRKDYTGDEEFFVGNSRKLKLKKKDKGKKKSKKNFK
jgi:hypothetical protein